MFAFSSLSSASGCNHEIVVPIKFSPGQSEWFFHGRGTNFFGFFQRGQSLEIEAASDSHEPWDISIQGPNDFFQMDVDGNFYINRLPFTGKYVITIGPCSRWGSYGTLSIFASDPRLTIE